VVNQQVNYGDVTSALQVLARANIIPAEAFANFKRLNGHANGEAE
jgi:hypothetical protein